MYYEDTVEDHINTRSLEKREVASAALLGAEEEADEKSIHKALSISPLIRYSSEPTGIVRFPKISIEWSAAKRRDS